MLGSIVHRSVRWWLFKVPTQNIGSMPLLSVIDLPFAIAVSPKVWLDYMLRLQKYQHNLSIKHWASLSEIYPRNMMWLYSYLLFAWARYCNSLSKMLENPGKSIIAEVFIRYVCEIDLYIEGTQIRPLSLISPNELRTSPKVKKIACELCSRIEQADLPTPTKIDVLRLVASYRRQALNMIQRWKTSPEYEYSHVLIIKEETAGRLWMMWSNLLGILYHVPPIICEKASKVFFNIGMAMQLLDDLGDVPIDHKINSENLSWPS